MRINVYSQEIDLDRPPELVHKHTTGPDGAELVYYGARLWLRQVEHLHHTPDDDDTSAITFWLPKSDFNIDKLAGQFGGLVALLVDDGNRREIDSRRAPQ